MPRVVSLDLPWSADGYVGIAVATVEGSALVGVPRVAVVGTGNPAAAPAHPEIDGFVADGAGPGRAAPFDVVAPWAGGAAPTPDARAAHVARVFGALNAATEDRVGEMPELEAPDLVLLDVPFVPIPLLQPGIAPGRRGTFRPVERAFTCRTPIPAGAAEPPTWLYGPSFQGGIAKGWRPGYAMEAIATLALGAQACAESFPAWVVGPLCEFGRAQGLPRVLSLAGHKPGRGDVALGQASLQTLLIGWVGQPFTWVPGVPALERVRADGYDAMLGLLPGLAWAGFVPPAAVGAAAPPAWAGAVRLVNAPAGTPMPTREAPDGVVNGCAPWRIPLPVQAPLDVEQGIVTLNSAFWA
jgi:hypothetical protein